MEAPTSKPTRPTEADDALSILAYRLGPLLKAVYLHGSAVGQGLRRQSDVDLLAVMKGPLSTSVREHLATDLMAVSGRHPFDSLGRRPLEIIIFQAANLARLQYPACAEFVYGEWLRDAFTNGAVPHAEANPEFTLVLAQARREALPMIGPDLATLFRTFLSPVYAARLAICCQC
jgi:streptomycin 3"-adenylyltransferase